MGKCLASDDGLHRFHHSREIHTEDVIVQEYLTCISCGERRAIGVMGDLLVRENRTWVKLEPTPKTKGLGK